MIKRWIENLTFTASNDDADMRRQHTRRQSDKAVASIGKDTFPIGNWSEGGVLLHADDKLFSVEDPVYVTMKFKLTDSVIEISQVAKVVRKSLGRVALQFQELTDKNMRQFQNVISDAVTREFAESQIA